MNETFDGKLRTAWEGFQIELEHRLTELGEGQFVVQLPAVDDADDPIAQFLQFRGHGDMITGEVSGDSWFEEELWLMPAQVDALIALGWEMPADDPTDCETWNYLVAVAPGEAGRLASLTVDTLRMVFGVAHPAFLAFSSPEEETPEEEPEFEHFVTTPEDRDELQELVRTTLRGHFGFDVPEDPDGDFPIFWGTALLWVSVLPASPVVRIFSHVAREVRRPKRAAMEVNILNRSTPGLKFYFEDHIVHASIDVPGQPFSSQQLCAMLMHACQTLDSLDGDLALRVGGKVALERPATPPDDSPDVLHPALMTLMQLDPAGTTEHDPEFVAGVCGRDRELILALLETAAKEELSWRRAAECAAEEGDVDEAAACQVELRAWERTSADLRRALRVVAQAAEGSSS